MSLLPTDLLLLLSLLFVRPAGDRDWRIRLPLHALLLAACLVAAALQPMSGATAGPALAGALACLIEAWLVLRWLAVGAGMRSVRAGGGAGWLVAGLVLVALSLRLLPAGVMPVLPRAELAAALGIVLTGLLGAVAAGRAAGPGRIGALLLGSHGVVLAVCVLPGLGWQPLGCVLLLQAWLVRSLLPRRAMPPRPAGAAP